MFMKEKGKQKNIKIKKIKKKKGEMRKKKRNGGGEKKRKKKRMRDSPDPDRSALSHFEGGFPKFLREWILGFGGRKEGRQRGSSRESYRYERCVFFPFLLRLSLPLMFAA